MVASNLSKLYTSIYSQTYSEEEGLLAVGNSEGNILLYDLEVLSTNKKNDDESQFIGPKYTVHQEHGSIYSLVETPYFCISGSNGVILGWRWDSFHEDKVKPTFNICLENDQLSQQVPEVNSLVCDSEKDLVYAACGDCIARCYDLETGKQTLKFEGHDIYIHDIVLGDDLLITCGEDGAVLSWDPRVGSEPQMRVTPHKDEKLARPHLGKHITSVDVYDELMVCGGGPRAGIFDLKSLSLSLPLSNPVKSSGVTVTKFTGEEDKEIIVAGMSNEVFMWNKEGEIAAQLPLATSCIYSVNICKKPMLMTFGGASSQLHVATSFNSCDYSFSV